MSITIIMALPLPLYGAMITYYHWLAPWFTTEKQRAYILSCLSAGFMTVISIPFVLAYARDGLEGLYEPSQEGWMLSLSEIGVVFFGVCLFADLSLGYFRYRSQIGLLTGWVHHTVYIGLMVYCLLTRHSPIFLAGAIMELPTFDLAISNLFPQIRNDLRFLTSFFLIRILYNFIFLADCLRPSSRMIMGDSVVPPLMLFLAGCLHVSWFQAGLKGYIKRRKTVAEPVEPKNNVHTVGSEVELLASPDLLPATPDDSPLLTPRTPSITPFSLRDAFLPTLAIPNLAVPKLAVPSIPALPGLSDLNIPLPNKREFKDAVKQHWEDRRAVLGGMGMGMNLNLGSLGLRRRGTIYKEDVLEVTEIRVEEVDPEE